MIIVSPRLKLLTRSYYYAIYYVCNTGIGGNGSIFNLANNQLRAFDFDVYYSVLTQMNQFKNARLDVSGQYRNN